MNNVNIVSSPRKFSVKVDKGEFALIRGDILKTKADVIVCPSNSILNGKMAVLGSKIFEKGGPLLDEQIKNIVDGGKTKEFPIGSAHFISAENSGLDAKFVSNVVSIVYSINGWNSTINAVSKSVRNTLNQAEDRKLKTVAFPILDTFSYENRVELIKTMANEILDHLHNATSVKRVVLVVLSDSFERAKNALTDYLSQLAKAE